MMRLFFALPLPEEIEGKVLRAQDQLREAAGETGIRWTTREQFHYTLKFLGETAKAEMPSAIRAAAMVASQAGPFTLTLAGVGTFPQTQGRVRHPQVLWIGATEGVPLLTRLAESLDRSLAERGFAPETRRFNPHLTLARIQSREGEKAVEKAFNATLDSSKKVDKFGVMEVTYFVLMHSELRPTGSVHTVLETFPLAAI